MKQKYELKPLFIKRMQLLLGKEFDNYLNEIKKEPIRSIRVNTLKISIGELKKRLESKGWKIKQPWEENPEVIIVEFKLLPGELGRALEHILGYYYIQELSSMLPIIALKPLPGEHILDLCSAPGSKTTQMAAKMKNTGLIIANDLSLGRIKILASNLERCGVTNTIITRKDGRILCERLEQENIQFDKILLDAPCSGEGTLKSTPKTALMWNINTIRKLSGIQKSLFNSAFKILKIGGEIVYSTCTHAPEENEELVNYALEKFKDKIEIQKIKLPIKCRKGISKWQNQKYKKEIEQSCRIYPQDNHTEGFFITKFRKIK